MKINSSKLTFAIGLSTLLVVGSVGSISRIHAEPARKSQWQTATPVSESNVNGSIRSVSGSGDLVPPPLLEGGKKEALFREGAAVTADDTTDRIIVKYKNGMNVSQFQAEYSAVN